MGTANSKLKLLVLPAQSGKTRKVEEEIEKYKLLNELFGNDDDINIVISANNRTLVRQTATRFETDLGDEVINGDVFTWMSGNKETSISKDTLIVKILKGELEMVISCSNPIRMRNLVQLLNDLCSLPFFTKKINIWIDEADQSIPLWSKYPEVLNLLKVSQIMLITATPESIIKKFGSIYVLPFLKTYPECYRRLKDMKKRVVDLLAENGFEFIRDVITNPSNQYLLNPGMRGFVPGDFTKESHEAIANLFYTLGCSVIILNGEKKEIRIPGRNSPIDLFPHLTPGDENLEEFNQTLARIYKDNALARFPLIITGYLCVQRGVTFQCLPKEGEHEGFLFDYGIIRPISNKNEAYQCMARLFGNIGNSPFYKAVEIFSNTLTFRRVEKQEEIAVNLAKMVAEDKLTEVSCSDLKRAEVYEKERDYELIVREFTNPFAANSYLHSLKAPRKWDWNKDPADERFILDSTTKKLARLQYDDTKEEISRWTKTAGFGSAKPKNGVSSRTYVCYRDTNDHKSVIYIVRILRKRDLSAELSVQRVSDEPTNPNPFDD